MAAFFYGENSNNVYLENIEFFEEYYLVDNLELLENWDIIEQLEEKSWWAESYWYC